METVLTFQKTLWLSKLQFTCPAEKPIKIVFLKKHISIHPSRFQSDSLRHLGENFWSWLSKLHSKCLEEYSDGSFFYKNKSQFFLHFDRRIIGLLTNLFSQFRPNSFLGVHKNCLRMGFFEIFNVFSTFLNFELKRLDFAHKIRTPLSTLLSKSLEETFDDKVFRKKNILQVFRTLIKSFSDFPRWVFGRVVKNAFCYSKWRFME